MFRHIPIFVKTVQKPHTLHYDRHPFIIILVAKVIIIIIIIITLVTRISLCVALYFTMPTTHSLVISPRNKPTLNSRQNNRAQASKIMFCRHFFSSFVLYLLCSSNS